MSAKGCVVYFVAAPDLGRIKIGRSKDLRKRFQHLQQGSPCKLVLLGSMPGGIATEMYLHAVFDRHRVQGEWFTAVPEIEAVVASGELPDDVPGGVELGQVRADGSTFRHFALIEQAIAEGHDSPSLVARKAECSIDEVGAAMLKMRGFGFLRGTYNPKVGISLLAD